MEVTNATGRDITGDPEGAIWADVYRIAGRKIKSGRSGKRIGCMQSDISASDMPL